MRESTIERALVRRAKEAGCEVRKVQWAGRVGAPDRVVFYPSDEQMFIDGQWGTTLWVELKAPGEKPRPSQLREHARMRAAGQRVVVVDSLDGIEDLFR